MCIKYLSKSSKDQMIGRAKYMYKDNEKDLSQSENEKKRHLLSMKVDKITLFVFKPRVLDSRLCI